MTAHRISKLACIVLAIAAAHTGLVVGQARAPAAPDRLRLYVFDCGLLILERALVERYHVTPEEVGETRLAVPCFLVAHPRGTLMWELGVVPDDTVEERARAAAANPSAAPTTVAPVRRTLRSQLAEIGYAAQDIDYFAFSHGHGDHNANANAFAASTWITNPAERAFMWQEGNTRVTPRFFNAIADSETILIDRDEYDVFGDGKVIIKAAPGHSPGHQVLVLDLENTGRIMLGGDLYHYSEERTLRRPAPTNEFDREQSAASRVAVEEYLTRTGTELWIEHDFVANAQLKKAPQYYD